VKSPSILFLLLCLFRPSTNGFFSRCIVSCSFCIYLYFVSGLKLRMLSYAFYMILFQCSINFYFYSV
jgi:hypothetical protein